MKRSRFALTVAAFAGSIAGSAAYAFADSYTASTFAGGYEEPPVGAVTQIGPAQDDATKTLDLPFEFPFFGRLQSKVSICSNGWLAFGTSALATSANAALPDAVAPNGIVAALWDDLATGTGAVKTFTTGTAPDRVFVVAWHHVDTFSGVSNDDLSFEVKLHETTGAIEVAYATVGVWDGLSYTAGIEDPSGTIAVGAGGTGNSNAGQPGIDWRFTPTATQVTGTLLRDRPVAGTTGLGVTTESGLPVAGIDIEIVRESTGEVAGRGRTSADGTFSVSVLGADASATLAIDVVASGEESRVVDASGTSYRYRLAQGVAASGSQAIGTVTLGASVDAANAAIRRAVNIQQAARRGFAWARDAAAFSVLGSTTPGAVAESFPRIDFRFVPGAAATGNFTHYVPKTPTVAATSLVHDASDNPDAWDDDVILREAGNHVFATIGTYPAILPSHAWDLPTTNLTAFADGFATWFACVVQGRATFIDTRSATTATVRDLEAATPTPQKSPVVVGAVASSLWDLVDPANEPWDEVAGTLIAAPTGPGSTAQEVFKTIDISLDGGTNATSFDVTQFFDAWTAADRAATARAFIHGGALADDAREPNDRAGEESAISGVQRIDSLVLSKFNVDRFSFAFSPALPAVLSVAVSPATAAGIDVEVLDAQGARVAFATNTTDLVRGRVTATSAAPVAAGTYVVRVAWASDVATTYSIAFFEPLRIATTSLPTWTAGEPFKVTLASAGGVAPHTFATRFTGAPAPGLTVKNGGSEVSGTPTTAGDYVVHVDGTDASGAGTGVTADFPLHINARLSMPAYLGVPGGVAVDVAVGSGGTDPTWSSSSPSDGSLTLSGGASLRLAGSSGAARTFTITASATDAIGADLSATTTRVVVCPPLPDRGTAPVGPGTHFGFAFDALADSRPDLRFRLAGVGARPDLVALVDGTGAAVDLTGHVSTGGRTLRLHGVKLPTTGRWFAIFAQQANAFSGTIAVGGRITPPRDVHGVVVIRALDGVEDTAFDALAGSKLRLLVRAERTPRPIVPQIWGLLDPAGASVQLPAMRPVRPGPGVSVSGVGPLATSGTYVLRIAGDGARTGPVFWRVVMTPPSRRAFDLF
ncbi:MAG: hypothetical protein K8T90_20050 [Planctomycetes bacterium]|nr:hypothetical protein [Planctomycetota bacterium]